mmetsp:Transcript_26591/g.40981  ORF Transcript_26591/g.40981 Transcript_26591/m.40981 type:complete len:142 (+) Transcript_26591:650-1075(+)
MLEYVATVSTIDPSRIKFGDEKHLKGQELFNRKVRRDVLTGVVPASLTTSDFRNTYTITGFCGIDPRSTPVWYNIHDDTNGASELPSSWKWQSCLDSFTVEMYWFLTMPLYTTAGRTQSLRIGCGTISESVYCFYQQDLLS